MKPNYKNNKAKINSLNELIKKKESEKRHKIDENEKVKHELRETNGLLFTSKEARNKLKTEIDNLISEVRQKQDEINRSKHEIRYNSLVQYDNMILKLENDMQFNRGSYRRNEETRVLTEILNLKRGKEKLKDFEKKKETHVELVNKLEKLKNQREENKNNYQLLNDKQNKMRDDIKQRCDCISYIQSEIDAFKNKKKDIEAEQMQLEQEFLNHKKEFKEKKLKEKIQEEIKSKSNLIESELNQKIIDCTKLIKYLENFMTNEEPSITNESSNSLPISFKNEERNSAGVKLMTNKNEPLQRNKFVKKNTNKIHKNKSIPYSFEELDIFAKLNCQQPKTTNEINDSLEKLKALRNELHNELNSYLESNIAKPTVVHYSPKNNQTVSSSIASNVFFQNDYQDDELNFQFPIEIARAENGTNLTDESLSTLVDFEKKNEDKEENMNSKKEIKDRILANKTLKLKKNDDSSNVKLNGANHCLTRQYSDDGYSGSQLSANSNVEQNPFFTENS